MPNSFCRSEGRQGRLGNPADLKPTNGGVDVSHRKAARVFLLAFGRVKRKSQLPSHVRVRRFVKSH
jgi:hypothetical protein